MELKTYFAQDAAGNIISSAIVNVFMQGTTTLATGLTRADGTPLENPFAADGAGRIQFRAPDGYYDVQVSAGSGIIQTLTIQCVDYSGAKADADRAEAAADRADVSAEQVADAVALRSDLASPGGAGLVGGLAKPVTWSGFSGGADSTGTNSSDAAFAAAEAYDKEVYIPSGTYKLNSNYSGRFTFADGVIFSGAGVAYKKDTGLQTDSSPGVSIDRFNRVFVGDAAYSSDGSSDGATSWLGGKSDVAPNGSLQPGLTWPERVAQFASITSRGGAAVMAGSHTKNLTAGSAQSLVGIAVNDNETLLASSRAMYLDAKRYANSVGPAYAAELQITNLGTFVDEYAVGSKKTFGLSIFAGGDPVINGNTDDATLALAIANNGAKFGTGITFAPLALRIIQEAGLNDYGRAMTLRGGQRIGWEDSAGKTRAYINSVVTDDTRKVGVFFQNGVVDIKGPSSVGFRVSGDVGDTAYLRARSGNSASQLVRLEAEGEINCSISMEGKGTGNIIVNKALRPSAANALQCGISSFPWAGGFTQTAFTVTSDADCKSDPLLMTDAILDAAAEVQLVQYQYLDRIEEKGPDGARWHFGAIAQRYVEAFERHGLDAHRFGFICYDEWGDAPAVIDEDTGEVITPAIEAGSRYGIRYEEMLVMEAALQRRNYARLLDKYETLAARIEALEAK